MLSRLIAGAIALGCLAATLKIVSLGAHLRPIATIPAMLGVVALGLACGPGKWSATINGTIQSLRHSMVVTVWHPPRWLVFVLMAGGVALGTWNLSIAWQLPTIVEETDQAAYLNTANQIQVDGGIPALIQHLYSGQFREANRHPFYLGLLSLAPNQHWGKTLSTIAVVIAVIGVTVSLYRQQSILASSLFLIWCSVNPALLKSAIMIGCEAWLMVWVATVWLILDADRATCPDAAKVRSSRFGRSFFAGLGLGLGWLTKGTALPLLPLTAGWLLFRKTNEPRHVSGAVLAMGLLLCGWIVSAHPLLVRNVRAFQSPFYNVNSWLMFVDAFEDPVALSQGRPLGTLAREYLSTRTVSHLVGREANGLVWESFILVRLLGIGPSNLSRAVTGIFVALLALLGASTTRRSAASLIAIWTMAMVPLFAWYIPIAADDRFLVPFVPIWLAYAAEGAAGVVAIRFGSRAANVVPG